MKKIGPILAAVVLAAVLGLGGGGAVPAEGGAEIPEGEKYVALTFDDGPRRETTGRLLDGLQERGATATFFLIGQQIEDNADLVARMAEEGHQIGNHTWSRRRAAAALWAGEHRDGGQLRCAPGEVVRGSPGLGEPEHGEGGTGDHGGRGAEQHHPAA